MNAMVDSTWLRQVAIAGDEKHVSLTVDQALHLADTMEAAQSVADEAARSDIETICQEVLEDGRLPLTSSEFLVSWFDTTQLDIDKIRFLTAAIRYLEKRNLLHRHVAKPHLVRFRRH